MRIKSIAHASSPRATFRLGWSAVREWRVRGGAANLLAVLVVSLLVVGAGPAGAVPPGWSTSGPNGGMIRVVKIHPTTPTTVYVGTYYSGIFKSTDAGATWATMSTGLPSMPISDITFDPTDATIMYAVAGDSSYTRPGNGLYKTTNGGQTWALLGPELPLNAVAVSPTNPLLMYTGGTGLRKSTDGGGTWTQLFTGPVSAVVFHPTTPNTVFVGCGACEGNANNTGIWKTTDGGATWTKPLFGAGTVTILFHPTDPSIMYAAGGQVYKSTDGGDHWSLANTGLSVYSRTLAIDPNTPATLYVVDENNGLYKTTDGGANWALSLGPKRGSTVAVTSTSHVYAGMLTEGLFKSTDTGATWSSIGPGVSNIYALAADPRNPGTLYAAADMSRIQKSTDGGVSWFAVNNGLPFATLSSARAVAVAPSGPAAVYAGLREGFYKSTDGGSSWTKTGTGIPAPTSPPLLAIAVDPNTPSTVFAGANTKIYRSTDSGATFAQVYTYPSLWTTNITIAPSNSQILYVGQSNSIGLHKSTNGGTNWSALQTVAVSGVAIHPSDPNTVYAAAASCDEYGGLFKSTDGFALTPQGDPHYTVLPVSSLPIRTCMTAVALEPSQPSTVYAGTNRGVFRSLDSGATWHPYGLDNQWITVLVVDPATPGRLYAGTQYSGVFVRDWAMEGVPIVDGVTPVSGPATGGQTVTIWGGYFVPSETTVTFNGVPATNVVVGSGGLTLTAVTPANTTGPVEIIVTTLRGSSTPLSGAYTYVTPTFTLTVSRTGPGTVTSDPPGITCGSTCSASVAGGTLVTLTATPTPGARFLGWSGEGCTGTGTCVVTMSQARTVTAPFLWTPDAVGAFRPSDGTFYLDYNGNGVWDGCATDRCLQIGMNGDIPLVGDWNGTGSGKVGAFRPSDGTFYLDYNGNGVWDGCGVDRCLQIGMLGDIPLVGDWNGSGTSKVGAFRPTDGTFYLDYNGNGTWDGCATDRCLQIGMLGDIPLVGDWNGSGTSKVGAFRPTDGTFYLDYNGNGVWDGCSTDRCLQIGMSGDIPLVGDWNGSGTTKVGAFRPSDGTFYLDYNGNGQWDGCSTDRCLQIGLNGDIPLVGDWNGSGTSKVGAFRPSDGTFYLDYNGNGVWEGCGTDRCLSIGLTGDAPLVGEW